MIDKREKAIHYALMDWAAWYDRLLSCSGIGYGRCTAEARFKEDGGISSGISKTKVPLVDIPKHVLAVDRAYRQMPKLLRDMVYSKYIHIYPAGVDVTDRLAAKVFCCRTKKPVSVYWESHDAVVEMIGEAIGGR